ncbi:MAG: molybdenum cofactor guanylyltransferase [Gallionella sp.]
MIEDCTAIILAGGDSRRMGQDKATLDFYGQSLIQAVIDNLQPLFAVTIVSVHQLRPEIFLPQICDVQPQGGPLAGLVSVLAQITTPWAFVVGCDMPFVSPVLVEKLVSCRADHQAVVPIVHGQIQPLAAFYSTSCIATMRASLSLGDRSLLGVLRQLNVRYVEEGELLQADPQLHSFFDLDTPEDLATARSLRVRGIKV